MQRKHRIFIAINLPQDIKKYLALFEKKVPDLPAKWTAEDNLHITLVFLGNLTDHQLGEVCITVKEVAKNHSAFDIRLSSIGYEPDNKIPPKMVWAIGEKIKELSLLKNNLENALLEKVNFVPENRGFVPHVTLARVGTFAWRQIDPEERPEVNEAIDLIFTVESIEVMESESKRGGTQYNVLESFFLNFLELRNAF